MTINKPEVVGFATHHDEPMLFPNRKEAAAYCDDEEEPVALIRLSDYEAMQAENDRLRSKLAEMESRSSPADNPAVVVPDRILELSARLAAPGPKCCAVSSSQCHEISNFISDLVVRCPIHDSELWGDQ